MTHMLFLGVKQNTMKLRLGLTVARLSDLASRAARSPATAASDDSRPSPGAMCCQIGSFGRSGPQFIPNRPHRIHKSHMKNYISIFSGFESIVGQSIGINMLIMPSVTVQYIILFSIDCLCSPFQLQPSPFARKLHPHLVSLWFS